MMRPNFSSSYELPLKLGLIQGGPTTSRNFVYLWSTDLWHHIRLQGCCSVGLIQTLTILCCLRPDFGRKADWLLEQCHRIWLAVGINGSWKRLFLAWLFSWMIRRRRREGSILLSFLLFYGLMVGKYALICAMEIQKIHMVVHIFSGFALFTELMWVYRGVESLCRLNCWPRTRCLLIYRQTSANQSTVHLKTGFIWKFRREWLLWTGCARGGSLRKKPQSPTVKY